MNKSPEEYFQEQDFSPSAAASGGEGFSLAERAFMEKYMGVNERDVLQSLGLAPGGDAPASSAAVSAASAPVPDLHAEMSAEDSLDISLRQAADLLMVGFFLGEQEFVIPTVTVQEVIRTMPRARLPSAPSLVDGVINLRGKVTPIIKLRDILEVASPRQKEDQFIIVCRRKGLQVGMLIERVHTMYRAEQKNIDWNIEAHLGINVDFITGLFKFNDQLLGIVSIDRIVDHILR